MLTIKQTELVYLRHCNGGSRNYSSAEMLQVEKLSRLLLDRFQGKEICIFSSPESEAVHTSEVIASLLGVVSVTKHDMFGNRLICASMRAQHASKILRSEMQDSRLILVVSHHEIIRYLPAELQELMTKDVMSVTSQYHLDHGHAFVQDLSSCSIEPLLV